MKPRVVAVAALGALFALLPASASAAVPVHTSSGIAVADLNGDKHPDVVYRAGILRVRLGDGTGKFRAPSGPESRYGDDGDLVAADFDGDGRTDLATADFKNKRVGILRGDGKGHLRVLRTVKLGFGPLTIVAGRFDRGRTTDVVVTGERDRMAVLRGDGRGGFTVVKDTCPDCLYAATGDFDKDGYSDLVPSYSHGSPTGAQVLRGGARNGVLRATHKVGRTAAYPDGIAVADFNRDGHLDAAVMQEAQGRVKILPGDGHGRLLGGTPTLKVGRAVTIFAGDFDGDRNPDLLVAGKALLGDGKLGFKPVGSDTYGYVGDINADGKSDLLSDDGVQLATGGGAFAALAPWG